MNESYKLINISSKNDFVIYQNYNSKEKESLKKGNMENELPKDESLNNDSITISPECLFFKLLFFIFGSIIFIYFKMNRYKSINKVQTNNNNQPTINNELNLGNQEFEVNNAWEINNDNDFVIKEKLDDKSLCKNLDPIAMFKLRIKNGPKKICQKGKWAFTMIFYGILMVLFV